MSEAEGVEVGAGACGGSGGTGGRRRLATVAVVLLLGLGGCGTAGGGGGPEGPSPATEVDETASPADEAAVLDVVRGLFDAMHRKDAEAVESHFHPDARLVTTAFRNGEPVVASVPASRLVRSVADASGDIEEVIWDEDVRIRDNLAIVWTEYAFYIDGELHHCGVNAFQLVRTPTRWTIVQIADTRREEGCTPRG